MGVNNLPRKLEGTAGCALQWRSSGF